MATEKITCYKCARTKNEKEFFKLKDGTRHTMCKSCLTMNIDNSDPSTFTWILEQFDVPYIEQDWHQLSNKIYMKNPATFGGGSVIGQYIRMMNMTQYSKYSYADSDKLNYENEKLAREAAQKAELVEEDLKARYERGEITQTEYETLSAKINPPEDLSKPLPSLNFGIDETKLGEQIDEEEKMYLITKWGPLYKPSEWIKMEQMYNSYADEYDLNIDREETLKHMCKTSLKLEQCIDVGDTQGAKNYATMLDTFRKSGKFTEAQNKEGKARYLDSVGELVLLCEREGGIIEQFPINPDEYPQDKIDFTLKDLKNYNRNLVVNELNLGDLIESYIEKLEKAQEESDKNLEDDFILSAEDEARDLMTNDEALEFQEYLENEIEKDAEMLIQSLGGDK